VKNECSPLGSACAQSPSGLYWLTTSAVALAIGRLFVRENILSEEDGNVIVFCVLTFALLVMGRLCTGGHPYISRNIIAENHS
jgi:hypothetical protein